MARLDPDLLLRAYTVGVFPMADSRRAKDIFWVEPKKRGILPLDGFHLSRSLAKTIRSERFRVTADQAFCDVVRGCAEPTPDRPDTWINPEIERAMLRFTNAAMPIRSNAGRAMRWSAGSTASSWPAPSSAKACSAARAMPQRLRWPIWSRA